MLTTTVSMFLTPTLPALKLFVLLHAALVSGTFLQWSLCDDSRGSGIIPYYLDAELVKASSATTSRLALNLTRHQSGRRCEDTPGTGPLDDDAWPQATVHFGWTDWNGSHSFTEKTRMQFDCENFIDELRPIPLDVNSSRISMVLLDVDGLDVHSLSTIGLQAQIDSPIFEETKCIATLLTPVETPRIASALRIGPLATFAFVLVISIIRTITSVATDPQPQDMSDGSPIGNAAPSTVVLPTVYDCLHFLQFIFLTGGLSLAFPGFYPAAVGHLSWSALFANFAIRVKSFVPSPTSAPRVSMAYPGSRDGLYEVNGTYGGYPGFEVMAQMIGSPMTCDMWALMVLGVACIALLLGLLLWLLEILRPRNVLGLPMLSADLDTSKRAQAARIGNGVLRLIMSYFTMPLVSLSSYQFYLYGFLGPGHLTFALVFCLLVLLSLAWLTASHSWRSLSVLMVETGHRFRKPHEQAVYDGRPASHGHTFIVFLFAVNLVRGLVIGALQKWGSMQLVSLIACELFMLFAVRMLKPYRLLSSGYLTILLRLALLACFVPFAFPPSKILGVKTISAYIALCISALGLVVAFIVPSCWHLYRLALMALKLHGGTNLPQDVSVISLDHLGHHEAPVPRQDETRATRSTTSQQVVDGNLDMFSRASRSPLPGAPGERTRLSWDRRPSSRPESPSPLLSPPTSRRSARLGRFTDTSSDSALSMEHYTGQKERAADDGLQGEAGPSSEPSSQPLGPRWNDYTFREADLYFAAPPPSNYSTLRPQPNHPAPSPSLWASLWDMDIFNMRTWAGWGQTAPTETGFSVVRPNRVPPST